MHEPRGELLSTSARIETLITGRPPAPAPSFEEGDRRVPAVRVAAFHGITLRSLNRWLADSRLAYPRPTVINGRRYWKAGDIIAWDRARQDAA